VSNHFCHFFFFYQSCPSRYSSGTELCWELLNILKILLFSCLTDMPNMAYGVAKLLLCPLKGWQRIVMSMSVSLCLCVREHISGTTRPIFANFFVLVTYGRDSVFLWRRCDTLCTSGLWMTSYLHIMGHIMSIPLQRVTSLRRRAQASGSAASYWLRSDLDNGGRRY